MLPYLFIVALSIFLIVTGILFTQGKCESLAKAFLPKKERYDWEKLMRFTGFAQIVFGICFLIPALLLYLGYYRLVRPVLLILLLLVAAETVYEYTSKRFRK